MEKVVNEWNMNMNTLNMAVVEEDEQSVWGFVFKKTNPEAYVFFDGNECARAWFNCHCQSEGKISWIQRKSVLNSAFDDEWMRQFKQELYNSKLHDLEGVICDHISDDFVSMVERISSIWNERCCGEKQDLMDQETAEKHAYGLLYWENEQMKAFFDNRLINTYDRMITLHERAIYPLWIRLEKKTTTPILVRNGCQMILEVAQDEHLRKIYDALQMNVTK